MSSTEERVDVGREQDVGDAGSHLQVSQLELFHVFIIDYNVMIAH